MATDGRLYLTEDKPDGALYRFTPTVSQSLDDGLGELPHYSQWKDPSGRDPLGRASGRVLTAVR